MSGPFGPTGPTGPQGANGLQGQTGATGPQGVAGAQSLIAFFRGSIWNPNFPYTTAINTLPGSNNIVFGTCPMATGQYVVDLEVQIGWNGNSAAYNSTFSLYCGDITMIGNQLKQFQWGSQRAGASGYNYGTVQSYSHSLIVTLTQGQALTLVVAANMFVVGAQVKVYALPPYVI
jgi:hypothetical protein